MSQAGQQHTTQKQTEATSESDTSPGSRKRSKRIAKGKARERIVMKEIEKQRKRQKDTKTYELPWQ